MDSKEYVDLLLKNSKEEDDIYALVEEENKRFENTKEYLEHREVVDGYLKQIHKLFTERMAKAREKRESFRNFKKVEIPTQPKDKKKVEWSKELTDAVDAFNKLSLKDQLMFNRITYKEDAPMAEEGTTVSTKQDIRDLHHILVQTVIDFINERKLTDIEEVGFGADSLQTSAHWGYWTPETDSSISVYGYLQDEKGLSERRLIDHQM